MHLASHPSCRMPRLQQHLGAGQVSMLRDLSARAALPPGRRLPSTQVDFLKFLFFSFHLLAAIYPTAVALWGRMLFPGCALSLGVEALASAAVCAPQRRHEQKLLLYRAISSLDDVLSDAPWWLCAVSATLLGFVVRFWDLSLVKSHQSTSSKGMVLLQVRLQHILTAFCRT